MTNPKIVEDGAVEFRNVPRIEPDGLPDHALDLSSEGLEEKIFEMDVLSEDLGTDRSQDGWITYWNKINDGRIMASAPDYYAVFKNIQNNMSNSTPERKAQSLFLMQALREDFTKHKIITSTRIIYGTEPAVDIEGKIIHHYRCNNPLLITEYTVDIPLYRGESIAKAMGNARFFRYMQIYFDTKDDKETIMLTLEFISGKKRDHITVWTANSDSRTEFTESTALLSHDYMREEFRIDGDGESFFSGTSRGVRYE